MKRYIALAMTTLLAAGSHADIFGTGPNQFSIDFVTIGNPGNPGEAVTTVDGPRNFGAMAYSYRMGKYEVSIDQFAKARAADGRIGNGNENYWNDGTRTGGVNAPASYVSWHEAAKFSNWLTTGDAHTGVYQYDAGGTLQAVDRSYRNGFGLAYVLPSEDEWYKAAYFDASGSGGYSLYAHGLDTAPLHGTNGWNYSLGGAAGLVNPAPDYVWTLGTGGIEQNGTSDMMGNVREWNESVFDGSFDNLEEARTVRGGAYITVEEHLGNESRINLGPTSEWRSYGFRVVAIPEPGTVGLMAVGSGILLFARRRHRRRGLDTGLRSAEDHACDVFETPAEVVAVPRRDCWNLPASCAHFAARIKISTLRGFDAFLALIMK